MRRPDMVAHRDALLNSLPSSYKVFSLSQFRAVESKGKPQRSIVFLYSYYSNTLPYVMTTVVLPRW